MGGRVHLKLHLNLLEVPEEVTLNFLAGVKQKADQEQKNKPSLLMPEKGCPAPQAAEYKPGMQIDSICAPDGQPTPAPPAKQKTKSGI